MLSSTLMCLSTYALYPRVLVAPRVTAAMPASKVRDRLVDFHPSIAEARTTG